jgi:hypothetical protein
VSEQAADTRGDDALEHLWNAAHEFLQAMRVLVDAADDFVEQQRNKPREIANVTRLHRIDIDAQ